MEKQRWEESEKGRIREEKESRERVRRKKMQVHEKVEQVAIHCVFPMICGSAGSKSRLAKAEAHFQVKTLNAPHVRTTFGGSDVAFPWQAHGIVHLVKSEQNVRIL